jgi:hypothetical protein
MSAARLPLIVRLLYMAGFFAIPLSLLVNK